MTPLTSAHIDLKALHHNFALAKQLAPGSRMLAMVKANAYGHGLETVARALEGHADALAVARMEEAEQLRHQGIRARLLVMSGPQCGEDLDRLAQLDADVLVHHHDQVDMLCRRTNSTPFRLWLKMDSGMHRLGLPAGDFYDAWSRLRHLPGVSDMIAMTHFASADEKDNPQTQRQWQSFQQETRALAAESSAPNSAVLLAWPEVRTSWSRPGIMLYGADPLAEPNSSSLALRAVMTLRSRLLSLRWIDAGEVVGYNGTWRAGRPSLIGTVGIGYGDGYPRHLPNGTPVLVDGVRVPLAGRVSMDLITLDLTDHPNPRPDAQVELWGAGLPVNEIARLAGTSSYELLTGVAARVPRCPF